MTRISIRARGLTEPITTSVAPGHALLVGRTPDLTRLQQRTGGSSPLPELKPYQMQTLQIESPRVSGNHLLILCDGSGTSLLDLGSRNGSWLRLVEGQRVTLAGALEINTDLTKPIHSKSQLSLPNNTN